MSMDVTSSTLGAAIALRQGMGQLDVGMKALSDGAQQQQQVLNTLLGGSAGGPAGGNVTETRGQNLNILV